MSHPKKIISTGCFIMVFFFLIHPARADNNPKKVIGMSELANIREKAVIHEFDTLLQSYMDGSGYFDQVGSISVAIGKMSPKSHDRIMLYQNLLGRAQNEKISQQLTQVKINSLSPALSDLGKELAANKLDRPSHHDDRVLYRVASNTKSFIGLAARMMAKEYPHFSLDSSVSPLYVDLTYLGKAHHWDRANQTDGFGKV